MAYVGWIGKGGGSGGPLIACCECPQCGNVDYHWLYKPCGAGGNEWEMEYPGIRRCRNINCQHKWGQR